MEPRLTLITLGVRDLERAQRFYEDALGWKAAPGSSAHVRFYDLGGVLLSLYSRRALAQEAGVNAAGQGFTGVTLAHNVRSKEDVDRVLADVARMGGTVQPAVQREWGGYSGYFSDPEGHHWEVAFNPFWTLDAEGRVRLG